MECQKPARAPGPSEGFPSRKKEVANITGFAVETCQCVATYLMHTKVTSQTIMYPSPNPNKKPEFGPRNPNPNNKPMNSRKGRLFVGLVLGLGILPAEPNSVGIFR